MPSPTFYNHKAGAKIAETLGYSQATKLPNGVIYLSGMIGIDENMAIKESIDEQVVAILDHIISALADGGAKPQDVYKIVSYHVGLSNAVVLTTAWAQKVGTKPTWTAVGVTELAIPGAVMEVQVEAWPS